MCEFKIIKQNDGTQILEDIVILSYTDNNELLMKDVLGTGEILKSALIVDVNTLNQTCVVLEHPLVKNFIDLVKNINNNVISRSEIESFQAQLDNIKNNL
ncbi:MAG: CooT family nickel-binding protein [Candidatus Lokiarchaeota archaeon]|nr:CooT family nickel-binding protein [Candidatus Lokiarchaeota archaeon]